MSLNFCMPSVHSPRVPCIKLPPFDIRSDGATTNPLLYLGHGSVSHEIFQALGGQALIKCLKARYSHASSSSLSLFFEGCNNANFIFVSCYNGHCSVEFRKVSGSKNSVVQRIANVLLADLSDLFRSVCSVAPAPQP